MCRKLNVVRCSMLADRKQRIFLFSAAETSQAFIYMKDIFLFKQKDKFIERKKIETVYDFFSKNIGTTLDCAITTKVLRNSITYYVSYLERIGLLKVAMIAPDSTTGRMAKHYTIYNAECRKE